MIAALRLSSSSRSPDTIGLFPGPKDKDSKNQIYLSASNKTKDEDIDSAEKQTSSKTENNSS